MDVTWRKKIALTSGDDIVRVRLAVREELAKLGFGLIDQTKMVTATSEIARNAVNHGGGGSLTMEELRDGGRTGLRLVFEDRGPGIPDIALAMKDGYTTAGGLGLGLGGARRLVGDFAIDSGPGRGTTVVLTGWKR